MLYEVIPVGVEGGEDLEASRMMADRLGTQHHEYIYNEEDMLKVLPNVVYSYNFV